MDKSINQQLDEAMDLAIELDNQKDC